MRNFNDEYALVRVLHAVPQAGAVDVYLNGKPLFNNASFTQFTPYIYIPKGVYTLEVYPKDQKQRPILERQVEFDEGELATVAITGNPQSIDMIKIEEDMEMPTEGKSKIRMIHLVANGRAVNVFLDGEEAVSEIRYKDITEYEEIDPGVYQTELELAQNGRLIRSLRLRINPDKIYSFYALGNMPNFQIFQSLDGATFLN